MSACETRLSRSWRRRRATTARPVWLSACPSLKRLAIGPLALGSAVLTSSVGPPHLGRDPRPRRCVSPSTRWRAGRRTEWPRRFSEGEMVGPVPLGCRRVRSGADVSIELDKEWAPFVERIFREYSTGRLGSARKLATRLNAEGIRPPTFESGIRADTLAQMLSSPAYIGMMREGGPQATSGPLERGRWPAIIDMDTSTSCRERSSQASRGAKSRRRWLPIYLAGSARTSCLCGSGSPSGRDRPGGRGRQESGSGRFAMNRQNRRSNGARPQ
jgi:hypothetical protein